MNPSTGLLLAALALLWPPGDGTGPGEPPSERTDAHGEGFEWRVIHPEGESGCAFGTPFRFFYREGPDPSRLMVYFQGGGACWEWVSCSGMFDTSVTDEELDGAGGIFDFENPGNPFREYSVVFVPYCTGDVHVGDTVTRYGDPEWDAPPVEHRGYRNVMAVLDWAGRHVPPPERLVVTGASAGSYGAVFHAPNVAAVFPGAELTVIGDSGVPLLHDYPDILEQWGAARMLRELWSPTRPATDREVTLEAAHEHLARMRPAATLAHITTDEDAVQTVFYIFSGSHGWREATLTLLRTLEERLPTFRAFVLRGGHHGLMRSDRFYSFEENGVRLSEWIDDLVDGRPTASRYCEGCDPASRR